MAVLGNTLIIGELRVARPGKLSVAVITTDDAATSTTPGVVKLGSDTVQTVSAATPTTTASRTYAIQKNSTGQLVVNVPWTDNNTNTAHTHSDGLGLIRTGGGGTSGDVSYKVALINETKSTNAATYTAGGASNFYAVQLDKNGKLGTYVPWSNTTYSASTGLSLSSSNAFSLKAATSTTIGGIATGYSRTDDKSNYYPVRLSGNNAYTDIAVIDCGE